MKTEEKEQKKINEVTKKKLEKKKALLATKLKENITRRKISKNS